MQSAATQTDFPYDLQAMLLEKGVKAPTELINLIVDVVKRVPTLSEATIVNLAQHLNITMFGAEVSDKVTKNPVRKVLNLHPYRKAGSGSNCMATYTDMQGQHYVLLGQKKAKPGKTPDTRHILLGGYFQPYPLVGHIPGVEKLSAEEKDVIEEAIRAGMKDAYAQMVKDAKAEEKGSKAIAYDQNLKACALRELKEESGLEGVEPQFLMEQSDYPDTNPDLHCINSSYLFHFGTRETVPEVKAGSDIGKLQWVKLAELGASIDGEPIRRDHLPVINTGLRVLLEKKITEISGGLLTIDTLIQRVETQARKAKQSPRSLLGPKPQTWLGPEAAAYYKKLEKLAAGFKQCDDQDLSFDYARMADCLGLKKPSSAKALSSWLGVFTVAASVGILACKLYQGGTAPTPKH